MINEIQRNKHSTAPPPPKKNKERKRKNLTTKRNSYADCRMVSEPRKQSIAWIETDYSKHTHFRWKIKWWLEHLGALWFMGDGLTTHLCSLQPAYITSLVPSPTFSPPPWGCMHLSDPRWTREPGPFKLVVPAENSWVKMFSSARHQEILFGAVIVWGSFVRLIMHFVVLCCLVHSIV